ncbi:MAG TPA: DUF2231 domain-containing protein [Bryobacteraceae bacterium]|jgi:uncharacterized membrane protein
MAILPMIPDWQQIHPLIVHFPIVLLLVAPAFILIGMLRPPESSAPFFVCALLLMAAGTLAGFVAVRTGLAACAHAHLQPEVSNVLKVHQALAETTSLTFCALTVVFAAIVLIPRLLSGHLSRVLTAVLPAVFLVLYAAGAVLLANTAHMGGCLVHDFGITATHSASKIHDEVTLRDH